MMHFKFGENWHPMSIHHYDTVYTDKLDKCVMRIQGKEYVGQSPELEKALEKERMWWKLSEKGCSFD